MKCVVNGGGDVKRVPDEKANIMVSGGDWKFCPKSMWKKITAGVVTGVSTKVTSVVVMNEMSESEVTERLDKAFKTNKKVKKSGKHKGEEK